MRVVQVSQLNFRKRQVFVLLVFACIAIGFYQSARQPATIPPLTGQYFQCDAPISTNHEVFDVYLTQLSVGEMALSMLCNDKVVKRQYGNVNVIIGQSDYDTFRYINHGVVDLALVKSNVVEAFGADRIYGYESIALYPDYSAYFIALREKPELTKEYLLGKRIGILDYPSSRSGHIVPKTVLKSLGLNDDTVSLHYYNSHQELRKALLAGDVDIISTYWGKDDNEILSRNYITALEDSVSGMRWYLKMRTKNTDLRCAVQNLIEQVAKKHPRTYYQNVEFINRCGGDDAE